jgi:hypothetical protein
MTILLPVFVSERNRGRAGITAIAMNALKNDDTTYRKCPLKMNYASLQYF